MYLVIIYEVHLKHFLSDVLSEVSHEGVSMCTVCSIYKHAPDEIL